MAVNKDEKQDWFERGQDYEKNFDPLYNGQPSNPFDSDEDHSAKHDSWQSGRKSIKNDPNQ